MKKLIILFLTIFTFVSCSTDDNLSRETKNRGTIEFDYKGERLVFGERSYSGRMLNSNRDTIGYFYTSRIRYGTEWTDFHDIHLYIYCKNDTIINELQLTFLPRFADGRGSVFDKSKESNPLVFSDIEFDGTWFKANFEGRLYDNPLDTTKYREFKNGIINVPLKGLEVPEKY